MDKTRNKANNLHGIAQFALFVSSYLPLFILIIIKQVSVNYSYLNWGGLSKSSLMIFLSKFGLSFFLLVIILFGIIGIFATLGNIKEVAKNGFPVILRSVNNKNSEAIGYIATYIIPFPFQNFNSPFECFAIILLLMIIYRIYVNSTLLLINPVLSIWYAIYEVEYELNGIIKRALVISDNKYLNDDENVKLYEIGHKMYFAINNN